MPVFVNWLLRLLPTNPICMRLVQGGSRRMRHLYIRAGYLAMMIVVLLFVLLTNINGEATVSLRALATGGAAMFEYVSYLQVGLICLLTPVFMAGAIAQEANPRTWDILLTTPLSSLQIVLGNLFGRLFFVIALLFSSLPLFAVTQYFGGVPGKSIFASYAIAGASSLLVAAVAVTLSVTRTAGKRAVFVFYISVIMYLFVTYAADLGLRVPTSAAGSTSNTTLMTPINPFLALEVLLQSNVYVPHNPIDYSESFWLERAWFTRPIASFCWLCAVLSLGLILFSTLRVRILGGKTASIPWYRRMFGLAAKGALQRTPRTVGTNPIAWREAAARGKTLPAMLARWGFISIGVLVAIIVVTLHRTGLWSTNDLQLAVISVVSAEIVVITLAALNLSATAVSREREDNSLDIILTTPIQPGPYLAGKLRGLIQFLLPMIAVPIITLGIIAAYMLSDALGAGNVFKFNVPLAGSVNKVDIYAVLPEGVLALAIMLPGFVAFCVMVGLHWSIKSKGTIGSVIAAVSIVLAIVGVLSLCAGVSGRNMNVIGSVLVTFSPINLMHAIVYPAEAIPSALEQSPAAGRISLLIGAAIAAGIYAAIVYGMHNHNKRTFMMTVRKLAGQG
jgi:ABC-type transport system involved in multi-copper enzyme maturation permease subunit